VTEFEAMECACGRQIVPDPVLAVGSKTATSWAACIYKCPCRRAYSNARHAESRRIIWETPELNVPAEVRPGLSEALKNAINEGNWKKKLDKFCSATSEDAITWTVFKALLAMKRVGVVRKLVGLPPSAASPEVLLWGVPLQGSIPGNPVREELIRISDDLQENPRRRTEPDVLIRWPDALVVVEVKCASGNDRKPNYEHFSKYLTPIEVSKRLFQADKQAVMEAGYYELVRNWRIGHELAGARSLVLVNLGPDRVAEDARTFAQQLRTGPDRRFCPIRWRDLIAATGSSEPWFETFCRERGLSGPTEMREGRLC
jgi:hypothetical protein